MNFSPLNDPEFQKYREEAHLKAGRKRRVKSLIFLFTVALISLCLVALLVMTAAEAFPGLFGSHGNGNRTLPPLPPIHGSTAQKSSSGTPMLTPTPGLSIPASSTPDTSPSREIVRSTTIFVDAGHGFQSLSGVMDLGAGTDSEYTRISQEEYGKALYEADLTLAIAQKVRDILESKGYTVIMSREGYVNEYLNPTQRAQRVNASGADVSLSVHANFFSDTSVYGARVYYCDSRSDAAECRKYAEAVAKAIDSAGASRKQTNTYVDNSLAMVNGPRVPAVLVETCFITNEQDARNALTEEWQTQMATAIVNAICTQYPVQFTFK